jgi:hypothetical protein
MEIKTQEGETIGRVVTNHSMDIYAACELCNIDIEEYDPETLIMQY